MTQLPSLLLLHGVGDDGECMAPFVRALEMPNLVVMTPDAPAHGGRRAAPGEDVEWGDMVDEAVAHAQAMAANAGPAGLVIGGHSMGATIALSAAARHPELFRGLYLEDPPFWDNVEGERLQEVGTADLTELWRWFTALQTGSLADAVAGARSDHPEWPEDEYEPWARAKLSVDAWTFQEPKLWVGTGWVRFAEQVQCPTLVVAGELERGGLLGVKSAEFMAGLADWSVHRLPHTGHDVRRDDRATTTRLLREFLISLGVA